MVDAQRIEIEQNDDLVALADYRPRLRMGRFRPLCPAPRLLESPVARMFSTKYFYTH